MQCARPQVASEDAVGQSFVAAPHPIAMVQSFVAAPHPAVAAVLPFFAACSRA